MCEMSKPCAVFEEDEINSVFYVGQSKIIGDTITDMVAVAADNIQSRTMGRRAGLPAAAHSRRLSAKAGTRALSDQALRLAFAGRRRSSDIYVRQAGAGQPINFAPPGIRQTATGALPPLPQQQQQQQQQQ